jgi:hypothetical protein
MKKLAILATVLFSMTSFAAETVTSPNTPTKTEMKLAKKKGDKRVADTKSQAKPATPAKDEKATAPATKPESKPAK